MSVTVLVNFNGTNGDNPAAGVTVDSAGDLFGTTAFGGSAGDGTVWEIKAGHQTLTTLVNFNLANARPYSGVTLGADGDLFGTTADGGSADYGTVWEIKADSTSLTTLASFNGTDGGVPESGVTLDAAGDLFGTTRYDGSDGVGTVWEIKAGSTSVTTLYSFTGTGTDGAYPESSVTLDAADDLFGTTSAGGSDGDGTVWEIKAGTTSLTTLASFDGTNGANPYAGVTLDAAGDIFGTAAGGGSSGDGTVWEIKAGTTIVTTLASFDGTDGASPYSGVTLDSAGDIFGTTYSGGSDDDGTVWEIKAGSTSLTTLLSFDGTDGANPQSGVTLDGDDILGTTEYGGSNNDGTVYEIADALCFCAGTTIATPAGEVAIEALRAGDLVLTADGRALPIRWIGQSHVARAFADPRRSYPIRIRAGALGENLPKRDLRVSPEHALFIADILVQAAALVDGVMVLRERSIPDRFTYYHLELASHELLLAEGMPAESFVDNVDRMNFHNWDARTAPDQPIAELPYPRAKSARQVPARIRQRLQSRRLA